MKSLLEVGGGRWEANLLPLSGRGRSVDVKDSCCCCWPFLLMMLLLSTATTTPNNSNNTHEFAVAGILPQAALLAAALSDVLFFLLHKNTTTTRTHTHTYTLTIWHKHEHTGEARKESRTGTFYSGFHWTLHFYSDLFTFRSASLNTWIEIINFSRPIFIICQQRYPFGFFFTIYFACKHNSCQEGFFFSSTKDSQNDLEIFFIYSGSTSSTIFRFAVRFTKDRCLVVRAAAMLSPGHEKSRPSKRPNRAPSTYFWDFRDLLIPPFEFNLFKPYFIPLILRVGTLECWAGHTIISKSAALPVQFRNSRMKE